MKEVIRYSCNDLHEVLLTVPLVSAGHFKMDIWPVLNIFIQYWIKENKTEHVLDLCSPFVLNGQPWRNPKIQFTTPTAVGHWDFLSLYCSFVTQRITELWALYICCIHLSMYILLPTRAVTFVHIHSVLTSLFVSSFSNTAGLLRIRTSVLSFSTVSSCLQLS